MTSSLCQAGRLLEDILDKTIEVHGFRKSSYCGGRSSTEDPGVQLFRSAHCGIVFDQIELHGLKKKPKIIPGEKLHEKSKKFREQLQSVAVDGADIIVAASRECQKSLAKVEGRESTAKREKERVAELKRVRADIWLRCIAREMRVNAQSRR